MISSQVLGVVAAIAMWANSGKFTSDGTRLESVPAEQRKAVEPQCRTVVEWWDLAKEAQSVEFRSKYAATLLAIVKNAKANELAGLERPACRAACGWMLDPKAGLPEKQRRLAAVALGTLGEADGARPLLEFGVRDTDLQVRAEAYTALGLLKSEAAIEVLVQAVLKDVTTVYASPQESAAYGLSLIGTEKAIRELERLGRARVLSEKLRAYIAARLDALKEANTKLPNP